MNKHAINRFRQVRRVREIEEQQISKNLKQKKTALMTQQGLLTQLLDYKKDYIAHNQQSPNPLYLQQLQTFLTQLNKTIHIQNQKVETLSRDYDQAYKKWVTCYERLKALDRYIDDLQKGLEIKISKQEEKEIQDLYTYKPKH